MVEPTKKKRSVVAMMRRASKAVFSPRPAVKRAVTTQEDVKTKTAREKEAARRVAADAVALAMQEEAALSAPVEVASARANRVIALPDGRTLSFAEAGDPEGFPVVCFFGIGGSRYLVLLLDECAKQLGLRVISPDRPGFGRSSPWSGRSFNDFANDVDSLCTALRLQRIALWGYSVGCAYAAACALSPLVRRRLAGRVTLISPWVPLSAPGVPSHFTLARFFPATFAELLQPSSVSEHRAELKRRSAADPGAADDATPSFSAPSTALARYGLGVAGESRSERRRREQEEDSAPHGSGIFNIFLCGGMTVDEPSAEAVPEDTGSELTRGELDALEMLPRGPRILLASIIESQRQGGRGFRDEFRLSCCDFGFEYRDLDWPARIYHGTADNLVSTRSVHWVTGELRRKRVDPSDVELFEVPGGTHNGMVFAILRRALTMLSSDLVAIAADSELETSSPSVAVRERSGRDIAVLDSDWTWSSS